MSVARFWCPRCRTPYAGSKLRVTALDEIVQDHVTGTDDDVAREAVTENAIEIGIAITASATGIITVNDRARGNDPAVTNEITVRYARVKTATTKSASATVTRSAIAKSTSDVILAWIGSGNYDHGMTANPVACAIDHLDLIIFFLLGSIYSPHFIISVSFPVCILVSRSFFNFIQRQD